MSEDADTGDTGETSDQQAVADAISRPDNVPEKFWDNDAKVVKHDQVLESYGQLEKQFGAFTGAPESYEFALSEQLTEAGVELNSDDPLIATFTEFAKENNISQDKANALVNMFVESQHASGIAGTEADDAFTAAEMVKLGDNATQRVANINNWAQANLNPEQVEGLADATTTAAGVQAVEALIAKSRNAPINAGDGNPADAVDMAEIHKLQFELDDNGNRRMQTDPAFRKMVRAKMELASPGENIITVG